MTNLRCTIKVKATGEVLKAKPHGYGVFAENNKYYNRSEYELKRKWKVEDDDNSVPPPK